jgi:hypothetical protein
VHGGASTPLRAFWSYERKRGKHYMLKHASFKCDVF